MLVGDLHCHKDRAGGKVKVKDRVLKRESFLIAGSRRKPVGSHPVEALLLRIGQEELRADALLCMGDMADQVCEEGMSQAWCHLKEIGAALGTTNVFPTLGNHDVDSRNIAGDNPFDLAKNLAPDFPSADAALVRQYWADGFMLHRLDTNGLIIAVNTTADHNSHDSALRGTITDDKIRGIASGIDGIIGENGDMPLRVAFMHHHPVLHSRVGYSSADVMANGDLLVRELAQRNVQLIVHGHRHEPRLRRERVDGLDTIIFAIGAFAKVLEEVGTTTRNLCHHITLTTVDSDVGFRLRSWEFNHGDGWNATSYPSSTLPAECSFSLHPPTVDAGAIVAFLEEQDSRVVLARNVIEAFPDIPRMLPEEVRAIARAVRECSRWKATFDEEGLFTGFGETIEI